MPRPITRVRAAQAVTAERRNVFHRALEIEFESGVGGDVILYWSDDGASTWSSGRTVSLGATRKTRVIWRRLGMARDRVYKVQIADDVKVVIIGAWLDVDLGYS